MRTGAVRQRAAVAAPTAAGSHPPAVLSRASLVPTGPAVNAAAGPLFDGKECARCGRYKWIEWFPLRKTGTRGKTCRDCMPQYKRGGKPERAAKRRWTRENAEKRAAHKAVEYAVLRGDLMRPDRCQRCPRADHIQAHHDDYSRPLDVMWLCPMCHRVRHAEIGKPLRGKVAA